MSDETQIIFPSKEVAKAVVSLVTGNRPAGWGRKSRSSYYTKHHAENLIDYVDKQIESGQDIFYPSKTFCEGPNGVSLRTLYLRINQSARFLCERLDPTNKYKEWWDSVHVSTNNDGLRIALKVRQPSITPMMVIAHGQMPRWRREFEEWIESSDMEPFVREGLLLSKEEIKKFSDEMDQLRSVIGNVNAFSVKVVKVNK